MIKKGGKNHIKYIGKTHKAAQQNFQKIQSKVCESQKFFDQCKSVENQLDILISKVEHQKQALQYDDTY